jgi:hypothetical protein
MASQMSSLANLPEIISFFSYSREDDEAFKGALSALRGAIQRELGARLGRSQTNFRLWQDQEAIAPGKLWESEIKAAIEQAVFFLPIVAPRAVSSRYCKFEFDTFLARQQVLGRADLVFPVLYIDNPALKTKRIANIPFSRLSANNLARALESQLQNVREETARLIKEKYEELDLERRKGGLIEGDFAFSSRNWEISFLDRAREEIMDLIVEGDNQQAELAKQRDKVYRRLSEPGQKQEYDRLKSISEELEPRRERLKRKLDSYNGERDRAQKLLESENKRRYARAHEFIERTFKLKYSQRPALTPAAAIARRRITSLTHAR